MYRAVLQELKNWKDKLFHEPLLLTGGMQTGKTHLLCEFGRLCFEDVLYIDCNKVGYMTYLVESEVPAERFISRLSTYHGEDIIPRKTLIIFDEVQAVPGLVNVVLKLFVDMSQYHICMTGTHIERELPAYDEDYITPYMLELRPIGFKEFLRLSENEELVEKITCDGMLEDEADKALMMEQLRYYFQVGGYPEAVDVWINTGDMNRVREVHGKLLGKAKEFLVSEGSTTADDVEQVLKFVTEALKKDNKKFALSAKGTLTDERCAIIEQQLEVLQNIGFLCKMNRVSEGKWPPERYIDDSSYKLYFNDIGMLSYMYKLEPSELTDKEYFYAFNGALAEQFVFEELRDNDTGLLVYWTSKTPPARADFLFHDEKRMVPIEIIRLNKRSSNGLSIFSKKYEVPIGIRISLEDISRTSGILTIPMYAIWNL